MKKIHKILSEPSFIVHSESEMMGLGQRLGALLEPGICLALVGDLGAGKTHFVKGLALGMGADDSVTSPTFPIVHEYTSGEFPLLHFDFYRLESAHELETLGWDDYVESGGALAVEWAHKFVDWLPEETYWVLLRVLSPTERRVSFSREMPEL